MQPLKYKAVMNIPIWTAPLLNPATHEPMKAEELAGIFCEELIAQELDNDTPFFEIPEEIRNNPPVVAWKEKYGVALIGYAVFLHTPFSFANFSIREWEFRFGVLINGTN